LRRGNPILNSHLNRQSVETLNQEDIKEFINTAMQELGKEDRKILRALYFKNISIHQLSKKLGISCSTVRYMRDRALVCLKEIVEKDNALNNV